MSNSYGDKARVELFVVCREFKTGPGALFQLIDCATGMSAPGLPGNMPDMNFVVKFFSPSDCKVSLKFEQDDGTLITLSENSWASPKAPMINSFVIQNLQFTRFGLHRFFVYIDGSCMAETVLDVADSRTFAKG
jgi:hypothetical protein